MFVSDEIMVPVDFAVASARLANLVGSGALIAASVHSYDDGAGGLMRVGPAPGISKLVRAEMRELVAHGDSALLTLRWEAVGGATGSLFPALDADIRLFPAADEETLLRLDGVYRTPLGALGASLDSLVLHRVAAATIRAFIGRVAGLIANPARDAASEPDQSWTPEPGAV